MKCNHTPFSPDSTLNAEAIMGGTFLICRECLSNVVFDVRGSIKKSTLHLAMRAPESAPAEERAAVLAESEQTSQPPDTWECSLGTVHPIGEYCTGACVLRA